MCGICGYIDKQGSDVNKALFDKMVDIIEHRGPNDRGTNYDNGLALGHRRLSIIDLSSEGHQPMSYIEKYTIVFNGEVYNYTELKDKLIKEGYCFRTKTDTEVILAAYDYWGKECVQHFNGMWAFCIYDKQNKILFCSRDRFGVKPFYYINKEDYFAFGSEIKQLLLTMRSRPKANKKNLMDFLVTGALDYTNETMFEDILQIEGGHNLYYDLNTNKIKIDKWYDLNKIQEKDVKFNECTKIFREKFEQAVKLRLRADVPVGSCLSGGLDSSAIVCMANKILKEGNNNSKQHTISSCFEDKEYDEQEYIDEVVKETNVSCHKVFPDINNLFCDLDRIIWHMDEPFGSTSIYAQWNVFGEAKKNNMSVMLDGQGADEQLAGYTAFYDVLMINLLKKFRFRNYITELKAYKKLRESYESRSTKFMVIKHFTNSYISDKLRNFLRLYHKSKFNNTPFSEELIYDTAINRKIYNVKNPRQYILDSMKCGMSALLHYEDRNSMSFSIEARVPFLDYHLVEAIFSMPLEYKIRNGETKAVMREGLEDILPSKIRYRYSKLGFVTPEDKWIRDNYELFHKELVEACGILSGVLETKKVMKWFENEYKDFKRGDFIAWRIICAGRWAKIFDVIV